MRPKIVYESTKMRRMKEEEAAIAIRTLGDMVNARNLVWLQTEQPPLHRRLFQNGMAKRNNSEVAFTLCTCVYAWIHIDSHSIVLCSFHVWVETLGMNLLCSFDMLSLEHAKLLESRATS